MSKILKRILTRHVIGERRNLISTENHYAAMRRLLRDRRVSGLLDAGASDGRVTRKLLRAFPQADAYLFEPQPRYRDRLQAYARQDPRVHPQFAALAEQPGEIELNINAEAGMTSVFPTNRVSAELFPQGEQDQTCVRVPAVTIDAWREASGGPPIEVMKFDIQAAELTALRGAVQTLRDSTLLVYSEVFFNPLYEGGALFGDIDAWLRGFGFRLYNLYKPKSSPDDMLLWANAIFFKDI